MRIDLRQTNAKDEADIAANVAKLTEPSRKE
jgi:hypothetical protein